MHIGGSLDIELRLIISDIHKRETTFREPEISLLTSVDWPVQMKRRSDEEYKST